MSEFVTYLDIEDLVELAKILLGDPPPIRDLGLLGSAAARPETTVFGEDAYPDLWSKAGALLHSIVKNHALVDGNKRLGWLATAVFLDLNGIDVTTFSNDTVYELVMTVAASDVEVTDIALTLRALAGHVIGEGAEGLAEVLEALRDPQLLVVLQRAGVSPAEDPDEA